MNLLEGVAAVGVHFAVGRHNFDGLFISLRCGEGHGQESESDDLSMHKSNIEIDKIKRKSSKETYEFHF
jgi:hypothetical protein